MEARITALGGDGVGPEVTAVAARVLEAIADRFGHTFEFVTAPIGGSAIDSTGNPLPDDTLALALGADAILFGAVGGPKWDDPQAKVRPEDSILRLRRELGLFANLRPVRAYPQLVSSSPLKSDRLRRVDFIIVRELTGGLYFASPKKRWQNSRGRRAIDTLSYSEKEIARVLRVGFILARQRRGRLHSLDKMNVLETSRLWREIATELGRDEYPDVELIHMLVDNAAMQIISDPSQFDVVVTENTFGDILSDEAAAIGGSMGLMPSASLAAAPFSEKTNRSKKNRTLKPALYEPIHGSAPDIAGRGIANPMASVLSAAMMMRWSFGLNEEAAAIEESIEALLDEGVRTADIARKGSRIFSTSQISELIVGHIAG